VALGATNELRGTLDLNPVGVTEQMIIVFGSINMDLVATVKSIAAWRDRTREGLPHLLWGKGANQAIAAGRAAHDGMKVTFVGAVGKMNMGNSAPPI